MHLCIIVATAGVKLPWRLLISDNILVTFSIVSTRMLPTCRPRNLIYDIFLNYIVYTLDFRIRSRNAGNIGLVSRRVEGKNHILSFVFVR